MSQPPDGEFRGRIPGTGSGDAQPPGPAGPTGSQPWGWDGLMQDRPARIPLLGLFLVLFGGILLVQQLVPGFSGIGAGLVVAIGIVLLISWGINRRPWELYGGTALIAIGLPPLLTDLRVIDGGPGWGTFFFGIALLRDRRHAGGGAGRGGLAGHPGRDSDGRRRRPGRPAPDRRLPRAGSPLLAGGDPCHRRRDRVPERPREALSS